MTSKTVRKLLIAVAAISALGGASVPAVADETPQMDPSNWCDLFPRLCQRTCGGNKVAANGSSALCPNPT